MDSAALVNIPNFDDGRKAVDAVKAAQILLRMGFWAYFTDSLEWRLILVAPGLEREGPRAIYARVQRALAKKQVKIPLSQISLVRPNDPLAKVGANALRAMAPLGNGQQWTVNASNVMVNTKYIYT